MDTQTIESAIFLYLKNDLGVAEDLGRDDLLFTSGAIDSFDLVRILSFLNDRFSLDIPPLEVSLENFDSVARIGALVAARVPT